jgi:hypothetical protein
LVVVSNSCNVVPHDCIMRSRFRLSSIAFGSLEFSGTSLATPPKWSRAHLRLKRTSSSSLRSFEAPFRPVLRLVYIS